MSMILHMLGCGIRSAADARNDCISFPGRQISPLQPQNIWDRAWQVELSGQPEKALPLYRAAACDAAAPRWALQRLRAIEMLTGHASSAIRIARRMTDSGNVLDSCILGGLLLQNGCYGDACIELQRVATQLLATSTSPDTHAGSDIERCVQDGAIELRMGRYVRAQDFFEQATRKTELALNVYSAWHCALRRGAHSDAALHHIDSCVRSLGTLADALLRYSARTRLAANLAEELRKKQLRADLAPWATGMHDVEHLLQAEYQRLARILNVHWNHAELRYRMGLLARAIGRTDAAERHWRGVLAIHPHCVPAAARLSSLLLSQGRNADDVIDRAVILPRETLTSHYELAIKAQNAAEFDQSIVAMEKGAQRTYDPRGNVAFALGILGLLDEEHCEWKNMVPQEA